MKIQFDSKLDYQDGAVNSIVIFEGQEEVCYSDFDTVVKTNVLQVLKQFEIDEVVSV